LLAIEKINAVSSGGGTEIYSPLSNIYDCFDPYCPLEKHIYLLTDGDVCSIDDMIELIYDNSQNYTLHSFGFGSDVSTDLVIRSAQAGGGIYYFIHQDDTVDQINAKIVNAMCKVFEPKIHLGLPIMSVEDPDTIYEYPSLLDSNQLLYHGDYFTYFKIIKNNDDKLKGNIAFKLTQDGKSLLITFSDAPSPKFVNIDLSTIQIHPGVSIFKMACKHNTDMLLRNNSNEKEAIRQSLKYQVATKVTSFIRNCSYITHSNRRFGQRRDQIHQHRRRIPQMRP
jgi:hypothetical protein